MRLNRCNADGIGIQPGGYFADRGRLGEPLDRRERIDSAERNAFFTGSSLRAHCQPQSSPSSRPEYKSLSACPGCTSRPVGRLPSLLSSRRTPLGPFGELAAHWPSPDGIHSHRNQRIDGGPDCESPLDARREALAIGRAFDVIAGTALRSLKIIAVTYRLAVVLLTNISRSKSRAARIRCIHTPGVASE